MFRNINYVPAKRFKYPETFSPSSYVHQREIHTFESDFPNYVLNAILRNTGHIQVKYLKPIIDSFEYNDIEVIPILYDNIQQIPVDENAILGSEYEIAIKPTKGGGLRHMGFDGKPMTGISTKRTIDSGEFKPIGNAKEGMFNTNIPSHVISNTTAIKFRVRVEEGEVCKINCAKPVFKFAFFTPTCRDTCSNMRDTPRETYNLYNKRAELDTLSDEKYIVWLRLNGHYKFQTIIGQSRDLLVNLLTDLANPDTFDRKIEVFPNVQNKFRFKFTFQVANTVGYILLMKFLHDGYRFKEFRKFVTVIGTKDPFSSDAILDIISTDDIENSKTLLLESINKLIAIMRSFTV
jgi:hypothetical protein